MLEATDHANAATIILILLRNKCVKSTMISENKTQQVDVGSLAPDWHGEIQ